MTEEQTPYGNDFDELKKIDVSAHIEKKGGLS